MKKQLRLQRTEHGEQNKKVVWFFFSLLSALCFLCSAEAQACPACKEAVAKMGEVWASLGFNWSVLFMMSIPYLIVGGFTGIIVWNYRKNVKKSAR